MKYNRIFRILGMAVILSLLAVAIPATPALAARVVELDPEEGSIGDTITVTGEGFTASSEDNERHVDVYFAADEASTTDDIGTDVNTYEFLKTPGIGWEGDADEGEFEVTFTVPAELEDGTDDEDVEYGTYYIYVTLYNTTRIRAIAEFTVIGGEISIDPDEGPVGTEVEISGQDFDSREDITVEYDGDEVKIESGDDRTDSDGEFELTIIIPESTADDHTITVIGEDSNSEVEDVFTVEPEMTIDPDSGAAGTKVTISGTGFGYKSDVTISIDNDEVETGETDKYGSFEITFTVPILEPGTYDVEAEDDDNNSEEAEFTIATSAGINSTEGNIGTELTVSGTGFVAGGIVTVSYDGTQVATATADANGAFSGTFPVPESKHGEHTIIATDGTNTKQFTFTVESTPPPIPKPLKPEMDTQAEATAYFDWEDVTDDSLPVTYTLQIASDKDFSSLVLEKEGLTESEYTIQEGEKLPSVREEAPYYWHIKAIDGASNESEWTGAGSFYIGMQFGLPQWARYILYVVGGLVILLFGFWLGRRTSYYNF
jgi:hypothetical protein